MSTSKTLDEAWQRAERALPEGVVIEALYRLRVYGETWQREQGWVVVTIQPSDATDEPWMNVDGPTPTAALDALTDTLTDTAQSKESSDEGKSGPS